MAGLRILLTGAQGQVGHELARLLRPHGDVVATDRATLDLADADAIVAAVRAARSSLFAATPIPRCAAASSSGISLARSSARSTGVAPRP